MKVVLTTLVALAVCGSAFAQSPSPPREPAKPARPVKVERAPTAERAPSADEDLALAALEGLMAQPAERALPAHYKEGAGGFAADAGQGALFVRAEPDLFTGSDRIPGGGEPLDGSRL